MGALPKGYYRTDLVADPHRDIWIKSCERLDHGTSTRIMKSSPASRIPGEFSNFMKCGENKTRLINLICKVISTDYKKALEMLKWKEIYFSKEDGCFLFNDNGFHSGTYLKSNQEEGDSKIILHYLDALKEPEATVVLCSPSGGIYIYIMVLAVSLISSSQDWVFIDYGNGKNHKAIKLSNVNMETDFKQALVGFHPFTGNDCVSSFFTKGKTASWKRMVKDEKYI